MSVDVDFPLRFDGRGRTAAATPDDHVRDVIEQLLLTSPGERVNRPDFGSGLLELVFAPNSSELAAALQVTMQGTLQRWIGDVIDVEDLEVTADEGTLAITVRYTVRRTGERRADTIRGPVAP